MREEYANLACSITSFWLQVSISSSVYFYFFISRENNADIFAAYQLISYCSLSSLILLPIAMVSFYILSERFFLKRKDLSHARVASVSKKECSFAVHFFVNIYKVFKVSDEWLNVIC